MHLYIYQVFREPHSKTDWVTEQVFISNPELMPDAGYIHKAADRSAALQALGGLLAKQHLGTLSESAFILTHDAAGQYLKGHFKSFRKALDALGKVTEAQYTSSHPYVDGLLSDLHSAFSNPYSDHVMAADEAPVPFDQFIRSAEPEVPFYIGGIMDCHY